jgi:HPt (histidine-containing phosphotransfer) domain-containing protein
MLDKATILSRLGGDQEIFVVMADMYLQDVDNFCTQLAAALAAGDASLLRREAHTVKGILATFTDDVGAALAHDVEMRAKNGDCAGLESMVAGLQGRLQQIAAALEEEISA